MSPHIHSSQTACCPVLHVVSAGQPTLLPQLSRLTAAYNYCDCRCCPGAAVTNPYASTPIPTPLLQGLQLASAHQRRLQRPITQACQPPAAGSLYSGLVNRTVTPVTPAAGTPFLLLTLLPLLQLAARARIVPQQTIMPPWQLLTAWPAAPRGPGLQPQTQPRQQRWT